MKRLALIVVAAALIGGLGGGAVEAGLGGSSSKPSQAQTVSTRVVHAAPAAQRSASAALTAEAIYRRDAPGVVVITDTQTQRVPPTFFTPPSTQKVGVLGSGFVIDAKGDVVTNEHVVGGATNVRVGFSDGATYPATVVGVDSSTDLAVVHVDAPSVALHPLVLSDSARVQVGDPAYAIGNPFGLDRTFTAGVVSAVGRNIQAPNGLSIRNAIQTDAAINHGNSGGPLLDRFGRVIGVNDQIESGGTVDGNVGVGFAVSSDTARAIVPQLLANGHAQHAWLGVEVENISPGLRALIKEIPAHGVLVVGVRKGSPAAAAGLVAGRRPVTVAGESALVGGDAIVSVDGKTLTSSSQLIGIVAAHSPGDVLRLGVVRGGRERAVSVTLGNAPAAS